MPILRLRLGRVTPLGSGFSDPYVSSSGQRAASEPFLLSRSTTSQYRPALSQELMPFSLGIRATAEVSGVAPSFWKKCSVLVPQELSVPYAILVRSASKVSTAAPAWGTAVAEN